MRHAVVDTDGRVVNVIVWDGRSPWMPPDGCTAVEHADASVGGTLICGVYRPPTELGDDDG